MNISSLFGVLLGLGIVYASLVESGMSLGFFLNFHGVVIVCGGTLAAASISFPLIKLLTLLKVFFMRVLGRNRVNYQEVIEQVMDLNKRIGTGNTNVNDLLPSIGHEFLRESVALVGAGVLNERELRHVLEQRVKTVETRYMHEANMFRTIGRYPPAFGLLATTFGMVALLSELGTPGSENKIGPAMSIGLTGTLYGIAIANFIFLPIAEALSERTKEEMELRRLIIEGAILLKKQVNPVLMRENLNSYLPPSERVQRKQAA